MKDTVEYIKNGIENLYKTNPNIHISVKLPHSKSPIENSPAKITGVYRHLFQVEEEDNVHIVRHTFQYNEVLVGHVKIEEFEIPQSVSIISKK